MNRKGLLNFVLNAEFIFGIIILIIFLIFLSGGGFGALFNITKTLSQIPSFVWIILIFIFLLSLIKGKRK